jgi:hypothetical protein
MPEVYTTEYYWLAELEYYNGEEEDDREGS